MDDDSDRTLDGIARLLSAAVQTIMTVDPRIGGCAESYSGMVAEEIRSLAFQGGLTADDMVQIRDFIVVCLAHSIASSASVLFRQE